MAKQVNMQVDTNGNYSVTETDTGNTILVSAAAVAAVYQRYAEIHGKASKYPLSEMVGLLSLNDPAEPSTTDDFVESVVTLEGEYPELDDINDTDGPTSQPLTSINLDKVVVSGDIGNFKFEQELTARADIITYYRASLNEGSTEPTKLSDDQIWAGLYNAQAGILAAHALKPLTDQSDVDVMRDEYLSGLDPATAPVAYAPSSPPRATPATAVTTRDKLAAEIGDRLAKHQYIAQDISTFLYVKAETGRMPTQIAYDLFSGGLAEDWQKTKDVLRSMPRPGSKESDDDIKAMGKNARIWDFRGPGKPTWYSEMAMSFPVYRELKSRVVSNTDAAASPEYKSMSPTEIEIEKQSVQRKASNFVGTIRDAWYLLTKFAEIEEKLKHITVEFRTETKNIKDDKGNVIGSRQEIVRRDAVLVATYLPPGAKAAKEKFFTRDNLLAIKVDEVAKSDDQWANLVVTRTPRAAKGGTDNVTIVTVPQFDSAMGELAALADDTGFMSNLYLQLEKPENADLLVSIFASQRLLDSITRRPSLRDKYTAKVNAMAEQKAKEEAEKKAKQEPVKTAA